MQLAADMTRSPWLIPLMRVAFYFTCLIKTWDWEDRSTIVVYRYISKKYTRELWKSSKLKHGPFFNQRKRGMMFLAGVTFTFLLPVVNKIDMSTNSALGALQVI